MCDMVHAPTSISEVLTNLGGAKVKARAKGGYGGSFDEEGDGMVGG